MYEKYNLSITKGEKMNLGTNEITKKANDLLEDKMLKYKKKKNIELYKPYKILSYDLIIAFVPFPIALICVLVSLLPIIRFRKMIMRQESLYDTVFSDTDANHLETTLYLSKDWLIWAGSSAIHKKHIQSIKHKLESGRVGSANKVIITTVDNKRYVVWCLSATNIKKIKLWCQV